MDSPKKGPNICANKYLPIYWGSDYCTAKKTCFPTDFDQSTILYPSFNLFNSRTCYAIWSVLYLALHFSISSQFV